MKVYKFRLLSSENEDFVRDIEVGEEQSFYDFYLAIQFEIDLDMDELASFFVCNRAWEKEVEILLTDMSDEEEDTEGFMKQRLMDDTRIGDFVKGELKQRFLFEYDFLEVKTLFIEVIGEKEESDQEVEEHYPLCTYRRQELSEAEEEPSQERERSDYGAASTQRIAEDTMLFDNALDLDLFDF
ncbi:MAG: hypothetical protein CSA95_00610 [Bacteroidetes bacterium]|nr:MAG: hypothetical protein CSA95_00610 [Bacteroidota bacterium]